jgi:hypothetical protein
MFTLSMLLYTFAACSFAQVTGLGPFCAVDSGTVQGSCVQEDQFGNNIACGNANGIMVTAIGTTRPDPCGAFPGVKFFPNSRLIMTRRGAVYPLPVESKVIVSLWILVIVIPGPMKRIQTARAGTLVMPFLKKANL